ncbi:hypothetical protein [Thauera humireducens]|uniref:hypothetical protein n=1 Tax=Thauera humireducens TaxID=1134435 RepID=UPI00311EFEA9
MHDLRHTSTTRFSIEFKGNVPVLMVITGHKTVQMLMRYVNHKATDVATMMHGEELDVEHAAAGYKTSIAATWEKSLAARSSAAQAPDATPAVESLGVAPICAGEECDERFGEKTASDDSYGERLLPSSKAAAGGPQQRHCGELSKESGMMRVQGRCCAVHRAPKRVLLRT